MRQLLKLFFNSTLRGSLLSIDKFLTTHRPELTPVELFLVFFLAITMLSVIVGCVLFVPFYWDTMGYFLSEIQGFRSTAFSRIFWEFHDYPQPPVFSMIYAAAWMIVGENQISLAILSLVFSALFIVAIYCVFSYSSNRFLAFSVSFLTLSTPIFLAQAPLKYNLVPALFLTYSALYFALKHKSRYFILFSFLATLSRLEAFFLVISGGIYAFFKRKSPGSFARFVFFPTFVLAAWIVSRKVDVGWWLLSPLRHSPPASPEVVWSLFRFLIFSQGRVLLPLMFVFLLFLFCLLLIISGRRRVFDLSRAAWRIIQEEYSAVDLVFVSIFLSYALFFVSTMFFPFLQFVLPRHSLLILPLFYYFFVKAFYVVGLFFLRQRRLFLFVSTPFTALTVVYFLSLRNTPVSYVSGNFEESLLFTEYVALKKEVVHYIHERLPNSKICAQFPEDGELTSPEAGYLPKGVAPNVRVVWFDGVETDPQILMESLSQCDFLYISPYHSSASVWNIVRDNPRYRLVRNFTSKHFQLPIYSIE